MYHYVSSPADYKVYMYCFLIYCFLFQRHLRYFIKYILWVVLSEAENLDDFISVLINTVRQYKRNQHKTNQIIEISLPFNPRNLVRILFCWSRGKNVLYSNILKHLFGIRATYLALKLTVKLQNQLYVIWHVQWNAEKY